MFKNLNHRNSWDMLVQRQNTNRWISEDAVLEVLDTAELKGFLKVCKQSGYVVIAKCGLGIRYWFNENVAESFNTLLQPRRSSKAWYRTYLKSPHWQSLRDRVMDRDGYRCTRCENNNINSVLHVHHLCYDRLGHESLDDLIVLCKMCHEQEHQ